MEKKDRKKAAAELATRLLTKEEAASVVGGQYVQTHTQLGPAPYTQNGTCPGGYTQTNGGYNQSCPPTPGA